MIVFVKRLHTPRYLHYVIPLGAVALALLIWAAVFISLGFHPVYAIAAVVRTVFGTAYGLSETFVQTIPLALCAMGIALAAQMGLWNIGAEGQLYLGATGAAFVALTWGDTLPAPVLMVIMVLWGVLAGGLWAAIAGMLRAMAQVNEIISTLMLNYIGILLVEYLVYGPWKGPDNFPYTRYFPEGTWLSTWGDTRIHSGLILAMVVAMVLAAVLRRTVWGYELRVVGASFDTARYAGMSVKRKIVGVLFFSGMLAGLAGVLEVMGTQHRLQPMISAEYGYLAIIVCWLAKRRIGFILLVAFLFSGLLVAGEELQITFKIPSAMARIFQGVLLLAVLGMDILVEYTPRWRRS